MAIALKILLIEDDPDDVEIFSDALRRYKVTHSLQVLNNGQNILKYLQQVRPESAPDVVVMDFNLPLMHGRDVVLNLKSSPIQHVPLIVLTTSSSEEDRNFVMEQGASAFITKPSSIDEIRQMVTKIQSIAK